MKKLFFTVIVVFFAVCVAGCAQTLYVKDAPSQYNEKLSLTGHPELGIGIRATEAVKSGKVTVIEAPMADEHIGFQFFPGKFNFNAWARNDKGEEGLVQQALVDNYQSGEFMSFAIIEGVFSEMRTAKMLPLSPMTDFTFDNFGTPVPIDSVKFYQDTKYRDELVKKYGVSIAKRRVVKGFDQMVRSWNLYGTEYGDIYSPYDEEFIKKIATINHGLTMKSRFVLKNRMVISLNPVEMISKVAISVFSSMKYKGFNPEHAEMAYINGFMARFRMELIRQLNEKIAEKDAEIESLKRTIREYETKKKAVMPRQAMTTTERRR